MKRRIYQQHKEITEALDRIYQDVDSSLDPELVGLQAIALRDPEFKEEGSSPTPPAPSPT